MARLVCPRCSTKFQPPAAGAAVCPSCGYSADVVPTANPYGAPLPAPTPAAGPLVTPYGGGFTAPHASRAQRNGLAIASLVTGIVGVLPLLWIVAPVSLVLGIVATRQIRRDRTRGLGMAVTGIVLGGLVVAIFLIFFMIFVLDEFVGAI